MFCSVTTHCTVPGRVDVLMTFFDVRQCKSLFFSLHLAYKHAFICDTVEKSSNNSLSDCQITRALRSLCDLLYK